MKVVINTTLTPYRQDTVIKPKQPLWMLKNTGDVGARINGIYTLLPYNYFGVDTSKLIIPILNHFIDNGIREKVEIINETQFSIQFGAGAPAAVRQVILFETSFEIKDEN